MNVQVLTEICSFLFALNLSCLFQSCIILQTMKAYDLLTQKSFKCKLGTLNGLRCEPRRGLYREYLGENP